MINDMNRNYNKSNTLLNTICFIVLSYVSILIFCPYIESHILTFIPFTFLLLVYALFSLLNKKPLYSTDLTLIISILAFIGWFYLCLSGHSELSSYKSMILSIGISLIGASLVEVFDERFIEKLITFITITSIVTIIISIPYVQTNYLVVRTLATGSGEVSSTLGIGGYDFIYCLSFLSPILMLSLRVTKGFKKLLIVATLVLTVMYSTICGLAITIVTTLFGIGLYLILRIENDLKRKMAIGFLITAGILLVIFGADLLSSFFSWLSKETNVKIISEKANDIYLMLTGSGEEHGTISGRTSRYLISLTSFFKSPLWGGYLFEDSPSMGEHSTLLDYGAMTGIVGIALYIAIVVKIYKNTASKLNNKLTKYILWESFWIYILLAILKNVGYASIVWVVFLVAPILIIWVDKKITERTLLYENSAN